MAITLKSGKNLINRPPKKNQEVHVELVPKQAVKKQAAAKNIKILGRSKYLKTKEDERLQ